VEYPSSGPHDYQGLLPRVREACAGLENYFVLGWSFSGPLALMMAAEAPSGLRGAILCSSFVRAPWPPLRWAIHAVAGPAARLYPLCSRALAAMGRYESADLRQDLDEIGRRVPPEVFAARVRAVMKVDARDVARTCPVRLLYLAASTDIVVPRWNAASVEAAVPGAVVATIPGPHLALRTNPAAAAAEVARFMMDEPSG
jgi:pimeloyl-ACP methyl ester carboxylesterase